jgi:hypothetical protein
MPEQHPASFQVPCNSSPPPFVVQLLTLSLQFNGMFLRNSDNRPQDSNVAWAYAPTRLLKELTRVLLAEKHVPNLAVYELISRRA